MTEQTFISDEGDAAFVREQERLKEAEVAAEKAKTDAAPVTTEPSAPEQAQ